MGYVTFNGPAAPLHLPVVDDGKPAPCQAVPALIAALTAVSAISMAGQGDYNQDRLDLALASLTNAANAAGADCVGQGGTSSAAGSFPGSRAGACYFGAAIRAQRDFIAAPNVMGGFDYYDGGFYSDYSAVEASTGLAFKKTVGMLTAMVNTAGVACSAPSPTAATPKPKLVFKRRPRVESPSTSKIALVIAGAAVVVAVGALWLTRRKRAR